MFRCSTTPVGAATRRDQSRPATLIAPTIVLPVGPLLGNCSCVALAPASLHLTEQESVQEDAPVVAEEPQTMAAEATPDTAPQDAPDTAAAPDAQDAPIVTPRRMAFRFEEIST